MFNNQKQQLLFILMLAGIFFTGCSKNTIEQTATVQITVQKYIGGPVVPGATVKLYKYEVIPNNQVLATQIAGSNGIATFSNLSPIQYAWYAEKGCLKGGIFTWLGTLNVNVLNKGAVFVSETGALKLINNSSEAYLVNGFQVTNSFNLPNNSTHLYDTIGVGQYTIHGEPVSTPGIGRDTLINITCGDTVTVSYP